MSHTCEFTTGAEADQNGLPVMIYCEALAAHFYKDRWLCPLHYGQSVKPKGGYIYRQGSSPVVFTVTSKKFRVHKGATTKWEI